MLNYNSIVFGSIYTAVEHTNDDLGNLYYNVLKLKKVKNELVILESKSVKQTQEVFEILEKQKHVFLIFNTNRVLFKSFPGTFLDSKKFFHQVFPNINIEEFYYESLIYSEKSFIAVVRKKNIDDLMSLYSENKVNVIGVSLGNLIVRSLIPFSSLNDISTSNSKILFKSNEVSEICKQEIKSNVYDINGLKIYSDFILSLAGILSYYFRDFESNIDTGISSLNYKLLKSFISKSYKKKYLNLSFVILVFVLLFSVCVNQFYDLKIEEITSDVKSLTINKDDLNTIQEIVDQKEKIVVSLEANNQSIISSLFDQIAEITPNTILFSELNYQPLLSKVKKDKEIIVEFNQIVIKGVSKNNQKFNVFINDLEQKKWVHNVVILNYGNNSGKFNSFKILIKLKE